MPHFLALDGGMTLVAVLFIVLPLALNSLKG